MKYKEFHFKTLYKDCNQINNIKCETQKEYKDLIKEIKNDAKEKNLDKNEISVEIDYEKFHQDRYWDGLKGYITNTNLSNDAVVSNYSNLWQIEKAFRMSKSDLEIRPIYHFTRRRIEAHISISFVAYSIYKELERLLYLYNAPFSVKKAREIIHNIYQIEVTLPDSGVKQKVLLQMDEEQQFLVNMIQNEISKSFG